MKRTEPAGTCARCNKRGPYAGLTLMPDGAYAHRYLCALCVRDSAPVNLGVADCWECSKQLNSEADVVRLGPRIEDIRCVACAEPPP